MRKIINPDSVFNGDEPSGAAINYNKETYKSDMMRSLSWFSREKDDKDARKYVYDYLKKTMGYDRIKIKELDNVKDKFFEKSKCWVCRLITTGATVSPDHQSVVDTLIASLYAEAKAPKPVVKVEEKKVVAPRPTIQDAIAEKAREYIGELEGAIDDGYQANKYDFSLYDDMKAKQLPSQYIQYIRPWAQKKLDEMSEVKDGSDKELVEGYSNYNRRHLNAFIKWLEAIVEDCNRFTAFKKANRKPRVTKPKAPGVQVAKLKYMAEFPMLGIKSIAPSTLIGCEQLWVYNTKTRKLGVYKSTSTQGLQVKGTTIQNYDPDQSISKTIRKPEEVLKKVKEAGKIALRKVLTDVKAKEAQMNGRINADIILLRAL